MFAKRTTDSPIPSLYFVLISGLKQQFIRWEPTEIEKEILLQNPKRRKVETTSTIGTFLQNLLYF